jgi:F-type H+-transporting ATPase subunit gamma
MYLESGAVEQVARRIAMKNATDSAEEMIKILTRFYNRARQYQITQEISELMGGAEALQKS